MRSRFDIRDPEYRQKVDAHWARQFALIRSRADAYEYGRKCRDEKHWKPRDAFDLYPDSTSDASALRKAWQSGCFGRGYVDPELPDNWRNTVR